MPKIGRPDSYESEQQIPDDKLEKNNGFNTSRHGDWVENLESYILQLVLNCSPFEQK
jgi:hypothetical protein